MAGCKSPHDLSVIDNGADDLDAVEVTVNGSPVETRMDGQRKWKGSVPGADVMEFVVIGKKGQVKSSFGKCELRTQAGDFIFVTLTRDHQLKCMIGRS